MTASKNIAIVYASKYGFTEICTKKLIEQLTVRVDVFNISENKPDLSKYDTIILGGPIHNGKFYKPLHRYIQEHISELSTKRIACFITCLDIARIDDYFKTALPEILYESLFVKACFGGALYFDKLHPFEREVIKELSIYVDDVEKIYDEKIHLFATHIQSLLCM